MIEFIYDRSKARQNLQKHNVSFQEAITSFYDRNAATGLDDDHTELGDERFINIGLSAKGRLLFVVHNEEDDGLIRIISARVASPTQRALYEEG